MDQYIGKMLDNRYEILERIGTGGMAIVYKAKCHRLNRLVAIKILKSDLAQNEEFRRRFNAESQAVAQLSHPNIVSVYDVSRGGDMEYIVMELIDGITLKQYMEKRGQLNWRESLHFITQIMRGLSHAHSRGIIHRDIKPQNIMVLRDGSVKVADFGIACLADSAQTLTQEALGSVHYISPEQARGDRPDARSDIYSSGVVFYEMLTGRVPFDSNNPVAIAMQHIHNTPVPIQQYAPETSDAVCHVCMKAMDKNPAYRYQSAWDMARDLRHAISGQVGEMEPRIVDGRLPGDGESGGMQPARRQPSRRMVRKKHPASWWVITLLMSLVVCYGLFVGTKAIYERVVNSAVVDEYIGRDVSAAQRQIQRAGLRPEIMEINHPTIKAGEVILQAPQEGTTLRKNDVVVLTVSKGPSTQTVPKITNLTVSDAITTLSPYGLTLTIVEYVVSATVPAGRIISQSPEEGSVCMSGDAVSVSVSGGMAVVPNVYGRHLADAQELIAASGLSLNQNITFLETDDTTMHGLVAQQSPSGGSEVIASAKVSLTLYRVPSMMARAKVLLSLPQTESMMHVRVTLVESGVEYTAYEGDFPANASREPEVELCGNEPGMYTYRVYCDGEFAYQQQVNME